MKYILSLLLLLSVNVASAADPAGLVKLRNTYDNSVRDEFQKVGKLYYEELVELKANYMKAQNLEAAVAVDNEIKKLKDRHGALVVKPVKPQKGGSPLDGVWYTYSKKIPDKKYWRFFQGNLMASDSMSGGFRTSGVSIKAGEVIIDHGAGSLEKLKIDPNNPDLMTGAKVIFERIKM